MGRIEYQSYTCDICNHTEHISFDNTSPNWTKIRIVTLDGLDKTFDWWVCKTCWPVQKGREAVNEKSSSIIERIKKFCTEL